MSCSAKKTQRYARIVASYLSAEKQHAKMIRTMTELGCCLWSHHSSRESTAAVVPLAPEGQRPQERRHQPPVPLHGNSSFHQDGRVLPSPACPWIALWAPELKWPLLFPAGFQEESEKELRSESKLRVGHKCGWTGRWWTAAASNTPLFSLCLLIVPLCHWKTAACSSKAGGVAACLFAPQYPWEWQHECLRWVRTRRFSQSGSDTISHAERDRLFTLQLSKAALLPANAWGWLCGRKGKWTLGPRGEGTRAGRSWSSDGSWTPRPLVPAGLGCCTLYCKHKHTSTFTLTHFTRCSWASI